MKIKLNDISVSFGANTILDHINFEVNDTDKIAIIGRNGSGKTTLLKVIMGEQEVDTVQSGTNIAPIEKTGNFVVGYSSQISFKDESVKLIDELEKVYSYIIDMKSKMTSLEKNLENGSPSDFDKYTRLCEEFDRIGGYTYQKEYNLALKKFGFTEQDKQKTIGEFSGGQRTKIALIKLLLSKPDLLILDEPTNHLDITATEWLENYLLNYKKAIIVVSHDRAFMDKFVNVVYEIERHKITKYIGNYTKFVATKKDNYEKQLKEYEKYQAETGRLQTLADRFRYKATKAKMAQSKLKQIDKMDVVEKPESYDTKIFHADIEPEIQSSTSVMRIENLTIGYDKPLSTITARINRGDRVGIVGGNGIGKSTLLKTIMGKVAPLGGKIVFGTNLEIGYFDQQTATANLDDTTIFDRYMSYYPDLSTGEVRSDLGAFMFSQDDVFKKLNALSGGELVRLELCKIFKKKPNVLVLDEPTNHLDIAGKEALEDMLGSYSGTLIFVSHDRYFVNKIATSILEFTPAGAKYYVNTNYDAYIKEVERQALEKEEVPEPKLEEYRDDEPKEEKVQNNTYLQNKERAKIEARIKKIEKEVVKIEQEIKDLSSLFTDPDIYSDFVKVMEIEGQVSEKQARLDNLTEEWFELTQANNN